MRAAASVAALAVLVTGAEASAQVRSVRTTSIDDLQRTAPRATTDWMTALLAGTGASEPRTDPDAKAFADGMRPAPPVFDLAPRAAVVVRDWRGSMRLAGPCTVLDDVRPSASARSILVRVAAGSRIAPFVQAGAGQWRLDPVLFPNAGSKDRIAASLGGGLQVRIRGFALAAEVQHTTLYGDEMTLDDPEGMLVTVLLAARATF